MTPRRPAPFFTRLARRALPACAIGLAAARAGAATVVPETRWKDLVPEGWGPAKEMRSDPGNGVLDDSNPRVFAMMRRMRQVLDNAPTVATLHGGAVRPPGHVVPVEEGRGEVREFLLVLHFGACIHTPPPPANQIAYVVAPKPLKGLRMMDAVWVTGTLEAQRQDTLMGSSGYEIVPTASTPMWHRRSAEADSLTSTPAGRVSRR